VGNNSGISINVAALPVFRSGLSNPEGRPPVAEHKFKIGERVYFHSRSQREVPPGPCQIIKRLAAANSEFQYVIRSEYGDHERVAKESELSHY
jgi:hypothetical protein